MGRFLMGVYLRPELFEVFCDRLDQRFIRFGNLLIHITELLISLLKVNMGVVVFWALLAGIGRFKIKMSLSD